MKGGAGMHLVPWIILWTGFSCILAGKKVTMYVYQNLLFIHCLRVQNFALWPSHFSRKGLYDDVSDQMRVMHLNSVFY